MPLSEVKMKLSGLVDKVRSTDEEIVITKNGTPAAVLISSDEWESLRETRSIRSSASLMKEIRQGLQELRQGKARLYSLEEILS
jgi:prevent-host-death family protein